MLYLVTHPRPERRLPPSSPRFQSIEARVPSSQEHAQSIPDAPEEE
jgi:hypothetical protein